MINKINFAQGIQNVQFRLAFKANDEGEQAPVSAPDNSVSFKGAEALANYNKPNVMAFDKSILDVEPILPTIIKPDEIGSIEGEKIYGSNGKLNSIVNRVGDKIVVYTASPDEDNVITSIVTKDKKTGNVIKEQRTVAENGESWTTVREYNPETGDVIGATSYNEDGEPDWASKTITKENGVTQDVEYDFRNGHYRVSESSADNKFYRSYEFNKNKELISIVEDKNRQSYSRIELYNGAVLSAEHTKTEVIPNNMGREVLNDEDIKPADMSVYPNSIEGEKTFYSNGSLESVTAGDLVYNYSPEGDITSIKDGNKTVEVNGEVTVITENLEDGAVKTTTHFEDGDTWVDYEKDDSQKHFILNGDLPSYYREEQGDRTIKSFRYDDKGMLISAWGDDI